MDLTIARVPAQQIGVPGHVDVVVTEQGAQQVAVPLGHGFRGVGSRLELERNQLAARIAAGLQQIGIHGNRREIARAFERVQELRLCQHRWTLPNPHGRYSIKSATPAMARSNADDPNLPAIEALLRK